MLLHREKQVKMAKIIVHGISTYNPQKVTLALFEKEVRVYVHSMFLIPPPLYFVSLPWKLEGDTLKSKFLE